MSIHDTVMIKYNEKSYQFVPFAKGVGGFRELKKSLFAANLRGRPDIRNMTKRIEKRQRDHDDVKREISYMQTEMERIANTADHDVCTFRISMLYRLYDVEITDTPAKSFAVGVFNYWAMSQLVETFYKFKQSKMPSDTVVCMMQFVAQRLFNLILPPDVLQFQADSVQDEIKLAWLMIVKLVIRSQGRIEAEDEENGFNTLEMCECIMRWNKYVIDAEKSYRFMIPIIGFLTCLFPSFEKEHDGFKGIERPLLEFVEVGNTTPQKRKQLKWRFTSHKRRKTSKKHQVEPDQIQQKSILQLFEIPLLPVTETVEYDNSNSTNDTTTDVEPVDIEIDNSISSETYDDSCSTYEFESPYKKKRILEEELTPEEEQSLFCHEQFDI